ncbi:hypothetical protein PCANC_14084 [Puccinia coronata f. sp. avenae]|uniref:Tc1-like transposase DDE domain-containing protein n=1 Tax=Puccinia coronata f. sp. avenae TaxID=200324 RepID=A0A2N5SVW9_9BASI|nr:hypothetical protein PCANC_14084 [Puccinia coronata f. sp. avenae]
MAVNKVRTAQRKRRQAEAQEKLQKLSNQTVASSKKKAPPKTKKSAQQSTSQVAIDLTKGNCLIDPILLRENLGETSEVPIVINDEELLDFQDLEIEERCQANDLIQLLRVFANENKSNCSELDDDVDVNDNDGRTGYQKPINYPNPLSNKLIPRPLPRSTKSDYKKRSEVAIGKNNTIMANWLIKSAPSTNVFPVSSNNQTQDSLPLPSRERIQAHLSTEALECLLAEQINRYRSSSRKISPQTQKINKAKSKWSELNLAISIAVQHSQQKLKKNPRYKYPDSIIANLYEFNNLRLQYTLSGIPNPSLTASLETTISSIRRAPPPDPTKPPSPRSGIYQACQIAQHATYVLNFKEIKNPKDGNKTNHKSILDNIQLCREIFQWASTQAVDDPTEHEPDQISSIGTSDGLPCCWFNVLQHQADFQNERPLLQMIIEEAGHICLFLPKFHCELNPIELFWSFIKQAYRQETHLCKNFSEYKALFEKIRKTCPLPTIRKYFRRIDRQISAYDQGYNGPQSVSLMKKYKSHRCIPRRAALNIDILTM